MHGQYNKLDLPKALRLRARGLSSTVIAQRLGVSHGAIYLALRKHDAQHGAQEILKRARRAPSWA